MNKTALELAKAYRNKTHDRSFDNQIIKAFYLADPYNRGKLSVIYPLHEEAFKIHFHDQDLTIEDLKERREST